MNIFDHNFLADEGRETFQTLLQNTCLTLEHIHSNHFKNGEWYDQEEDEWVMLVTGKAQIEFEERIENLQSGDTLFITSHERHRIVSTSDDAHWIALHVKNTNS